MKITTNKEDSMWISAPEPTPEQRRMATEAVTRMLEMRRAEREPESIPTDELSNEELRAYVDSILGE